MQRKSGLNEDFAVSVSDGLYERGVYINRIEQGGPADKHVLQPYNKMLEAI